MLKRFSAFIVTIVLFLPVYIMAGLYDNDDDLIQVDTVEEQSTGSLLNSSIVKPPPTAVPAPTAKPTPKPTPKPAPKPKKKTVYKPAPTPKPTPVPTVAALPNFQVASLSVEEVVINKNSANYYGMLPLLTGEKKLRLTMAIENIGQGSAMNTTAELRAAHPRIMITENIKNLQTILKGEKKELYYNVERITGYDGPVNIQLTLKLTSGNIEKIFPLEVFAEPFNPMIIYAILAGIILLIIIIILIILKSSGKKKKSKDYTLE
ncbi:MAG: hypothetical protein JXR81_10055 [Candidatus Goldbacteria bacterium]|nr:hypothetical protein [Candidatus Goldiibacteriota bacterium]